MTLPGIETWIEQTPMGNSPDELDVEFRVKYAKRVPIAVVLVATHRLAHHSSINLAELAAEKASEQWVGLAQSRTKTPTHP